MTPDEKRILDELNRLRRVVVEEDLTLTEKAQLAKTRELFPALAAADISLTSLRRPFTIQEVRSFIQDTVDLAMQSPVLRSRGLFIGEAGEPHAAVRRELVVGLVGSMLLNDQFDLSPSAFADATGVNQAVMDVVLDQNERVRAFPGSATKEMQLSGVIRALEQTGFITLEMRQAILQEDGYNRSLLSEAREILAPILNNMDEFVTGAISARSTSILEGGIDPNTGQPFDLTPQDFGSSVVSYIGGLSTKDIGAGNTPIPPILLPEVPDITEGRERLEGALAFKSGKTEFGTDQIKNAVEAQIKSLVDPQTGKQAFSLNRARYDYGDEGQAQYDAVRAAADRAIDLVQSAAATGRTGQTPAEFVAFLADQTLSIVNLATFKISVANVTDEQAEAKIETKRLEDVKNFQTKANRTRFLQNLAAGIDNPETGKALTLDDFSDDQRALFHRALINGNQELVESAFASKTFLLDAVGTKSQQDLSKEEQNRLKELQGSLSSRQSAVKNLLDTRGGGVKSEDLPDTFVSYLGHRLAKGHRISDEELELIIADGLAEKARADAAERIEGFRGDSAATLTALENQLRSVSERRIGTEDLTEETKEAYANFVANGGQITKDMATEGKRIKDVQDAEEQRIEDVEKANVAALKTSELERTLQGLGIGQLGGDDAFQQNLRQNVLPKLATHLETIRRGLGPGEELDAAQLVGTMLGIPGFQEEPVGGVGLDEQIPGLGKPVPEDGDQDFPPLGVSPSTIPKSTGELDQFYGGTFKPEDTTGEFLPGFSFPDFQKDLEGDSDPGPRTLGSLFDEATKAVIKGTPQPMPGTGILSSDVSREEFNRRFNEADTPGLPSQYRMVLAELGMPQLPTLGAVGTTTQEELLNIQEDTDLDTLRFSEEASEGDPFFQKFILEQLQTEDFETQLRESATEAAEIKEKAAFAKYGEVWGPEGLISDPTPYYSDEDLKRLSDTQLSRVEKSMLQRTPGMPRGTTAFNIASKPDPISPVGFAKTQKSRLREEFNLLPATVQRRQIEQENRLADLETEQERQKKRALSRGGRTVFQGLR